MQESDVLHLLRRDCPASYWEFSDIVKRIPQELAMTLVDKKYEFGYEIITHELIESLSQRITRWLKVKNTLTVMEVGAGNGRLSLHLHRSLQSKVPGKVNIVAIDNHRESWGEKLFPIDNTTFSESVTKYKPDIVLCSRMPQHVTPEFVDSCRHIFDIEEYIRHREKAIEDTKNPDYREQTSIRRRHSDLLEYILIGPTHSCGDARLTYGIKKFPSNVYDVSTMQRRAQSNDILWDEKPVFHPDGFLREELMDVLNLNIFDFLEGKHFVQSGSSTHSFVNVRFLQPQELHRLNTMHDQLMAYQKQRFAKK